MCQSSRLSVRSSLLLLLPLSLLLDKGVVILEHVDCSSRGTTLDLPFSDLSIDVSSDSNGVLSHLSHSSSWAFHVGDHVVVSHEILKHSFI